MKNYSFIKILFLIQFFIPAVLSQPISKINFNMQVDKANSDNVFYTKVWNNQIGGLILPSVGTVNALIIFSQFPDDNFDTTNIRWPKGKAPADENNWVSQSWTSNPVKGSLTHYFNEMSFNKFKFIGKTVSVISPHTRQWYLDNGWKRGDIQKEIILKVNQTMNFSQFDNWNWIGYYKQLNEPDKSIDLIIFIWRNIAKELKNEKEIKSNLDFSDDVRNLGGFQSLAHTIDYVFNVDNGARRVVMKYGGITVRNYLPDRNLAFRITIHEIGHYLLGDNRFHNGFGFWGMVSSYGVKSIAANSFERARLGWITLKTITNSPARTIYDAKLSDFVTTGDAYCMEIDSASGKYFYIENHQCISYWETEFKFGNIEKGLYVIRKDNLTPSNEEDIPSSAFMRLIPADGKFDWKVVQTVKNPWGSDPVYLPVFKKLKPDNINGYDDLDFIPWTLNGISQTAIPIYYTENQDSTPQLDIKFQGDGGDAFRIGYNEVFTPWSNPNSYKADRKPTPFGLKLDSLVNGVYSIDFYVHNSIEAPPSKPIGISVTSDSNSNGVRIEWQSNQEPDFSEYEILRKSNEGDVKWRIIKNTRDTFYIDNPIYYKSSDGNVSYEIKAKDSQDLYSVDSRIESITFSALHKITDVHDENMIKQYVLYQNYPNPFNPVTRIRYTIPEESVVTIAVYNVLGEKIATLINERKPAGKYSVNFNGDNLTSGVYFYRMQAGNFVSTKKFVLLK